MLALLAAGLLILAFPDFEFWFLAWFALAPLMWAVERETERGHSCPHEPEGRRGIFRMLCGHESPRSFLLGWLFGTAFFFGTCWWLTYALIHYAAIPWPIAYALILIACLGAGVFPGIFAAILSLLLRRFGSWAFLAAPFVWVFTEFLRYWMTGNSWNAIGYSQAFRPSLLVFANSGGVHLVGFLALGFNATTVFAVAYKAQRNTWLALTFLVLLAGFVHLAGFFFTFPDFDYIERDNAAALVVIQPNVPMSGFTTEKWQELREKQVRLAETALEMTGFPEFGKKRVPDAVILPESPMNFTYHDDREFQQFIGDFARRNNISVLFNSAEPDATNGRYFNSAVMVGPDGSEIAQYDKVYLLPFGEAVPVPLESIVPAFVGNFSYGREYDLLPVGDAKAGIMICFESHFGQLSREYVRNGADVIIEMTNDGYLGPTPVLRQHLANAVFRAVETNRPVLRVTNVGITAYIDERGQVHDPLPVYQEGTRVWTVSKSDGSQTFYVKYGDWFAWLCTVVTMAMVILSFRRRSAVAEARTQ